MRVGEVRVRVRLDKTRPSQDKGNDKDKGQREAGEDKEKD